MSFPTQPTFIHHGDWSSASQAHPAMAFMEKYTNRLDSGYSVMGGELPKWHTPDFTYVTATGETASGVDAAYAKLGETYAMLPRFHHEPFYLACHESQESKGDYVMIGLAHVYVDTPGGKTGAPGVKDGKGNEWEVTLPGAFKFLYRKDESGVNGFRLAKTEIFSDSAPVVRLLLKKKVVTPEQLGLA
jgi:hypothetical protein